MEITPDFEPNTDIGTNEDSSKSDCVAGNLAVRSIMKQVSDYIYEADINSNEAQKEEYQSQSIMTMTQEQMVLKLYEEIIKQLNIGIQSIDNEPDIDKRNASLQKAQKILYHLRMTLDYDYEISNYLNLMYEIFIKNIVEANVKSISKPLKDILPAIIDLRNTCAKS